MKRRLLGLVFMCLMMLSASAMAEQELFAEVNGQGVYVSWSTEDESACAVLTLYRDGWPVMVSNVDYETGECTLPGWYVRREGRYTVRLKTDSGCRTTEVDEDQAQPDEEPTAQPTAVPTAEPTAQPTAVPTAEPTAQPTAVPTAEPTAQPTMRPTANPAEDSASQVIAMVNAERAAAGLGALTQDADLTAAACVRAKEIVEQFSHTRPDGSSWSTVSSKAYGENIAMGYRTAEAVMTGWMNSEGHRENILRSSFGSIGVCAYTVNGVTYWVQLFGR